MALDISPNRKALLPLLEDVERSLKKNYLTVHSQLCQVICYFVDLSYLLNNDIQLVVGLLIVHNHLK